MTDPLKLTCAGYARVMPLVTGEIALEGGKMELLLGALGSWPERATMLKRALTDPAVHGGEASMGVHLARIGRGDRSFVALPIFVLRNFTARDIYIRQGAPLHTASDLAGKRVGMYSWTASGSIWYRHFLAHHGVDIPGVAWTIGEIDKPSAGKPDPAWPTFVHPAPEGRTLAEMLLAGDLDAIYSPPRPNAYHPVDGPIARLYPDAHTVELAYFKATGICPPQHLMVLRRDVWEADPTLARRVTEAFIRCETRFLEGITAFPYTTPWQDQDLEAATASLGPNPYTHGIEQNRKAMQEFCAQGHRLGLTPNLVTVEDYFAEYLKPD